jgi:hypothetical protein
MPFPLEMAFGIFLKLTHSQLFFTSEFRSERLGPKHDRDPPRNTRDIKRKKEFAAFPLFFFEYNSLTEAFLHHEL